MISFKEDGHIYSSIVDPARKWLGVTTLVSKLHEKFPREEKAQSCSTRKPGKWPNKWYGVSPQDILAAWDGEANRSKELGHQYHAKREEALYGQPGVVVPIWENGVKIARDQKLSNGIYPEHLVYLDSIGICGQSDLVIVEDNLLSIRDYKTSKEIRREAFGKDSYLGPKMMLTPVAHLQDCEFNHYALQLSIYAYIIQKHNPLFKVKELIIEHVKFEIESEDQWGYPIYKRDDNNEFIVKEIEEIKLPYMAKEVQAIINWLKTQG